MAGRIQTLRHYRVLLETALNRPPKQLAYVVRRKLHESIIPRLPVDVEGRYESEIPDSIDSVWHPFDNQLKKLQTALTISNRQALREAAREALRGNITFIGNTVSFQDPTNLDWEHPDIDERPLLWLLKFQGLEHLSWFHFGFDSPDDVDGSERTNDWIRDWAATHTIGSKPGYLREAWMPHSVSLRILNLCRHYSWAIDEFDEQTERVLKRSVYKNALFLMDHVEHGVGGNHLIENAAALVAAGIFLDNPEFTEEGRRLLETCAETQLLDDGGHYERSPMYHLIVARRFVTAFSLLDTANVSGLHGLQAAACEAVNFIKRLQPPDDDIPLLNDSVFGEALKPTELVAYADRVGIEGITNSKDHLVPTGYYLLGDEANRLLFDGGPIAVAQQPGHAHADPFTVCMWVDGKRIITDTGTYSYRADERRQYVRSIAAHNTVEVADSNPVDISGSFLLSQNVRPEVTHRAGDVMKVDGSYRPRSRECPDYTHRRRAYHNRDWWILRDDVTAKNDHPVTSRLHLDPDCNVRREDSCQVTVLRTGSELLKVTSVGAEVTVETSEFYPRFSTVVERPVLVAESPASTIHEMGWILSLTAGTSVQVSREDDRWHLERGAEEWYLGSSQ